MVTQIDVPLEEQVIEVGLYKGMKRKQVVWPFGYQRFYSEGLFKLVALLVNMRLDIVWQKEKPEWCNPDAYVREIKNFVRKQIRTCQDVDKRMFYEYIQENIGGILEGARRWDLKDYKVGGYPFQKF